MPNHPHTQTHLLEQGQRAALVYARLVRLPVCVALVILVAGASACDRRRNLTGRYGELVVVLTEGSTEVLSRDARVAVATAPMGETSTGTFTVRNIGDGELTLTTLALELGSPAFTIELPERASLGPTEEATFTVTFAPEQATDATLQRVLHEATFTLESEGTREGDGEATIELFADAQARDCYVPAVLDFGDAPIGQAVLMPLSLANATTVDATATLSVITGANPGFFSIEPAGPTIDAPAGAALAAQVRFAPQTEAEVNAQVTVRRRASCPEGTTRLTGRGSMQSLSWAPAELNFGRLPVDETATRTVTFSNRSGAAIPLAITIDGEGFATPATEATLPARSSVALTVTCRPRMLGALAGTLRVDVGTSPVLPARVALRCSGGGPRLRATPAMLAFGNVPLLNDPTTNKPAAQSLQPVVTRRLRIENVGTPPASMADTTYNLRLGRDGQPPLMSLSPLGNTLQGEFSVSVVRSPADGVPAIAGKNFIDVEVRVQPAAIGTREAALLLYSNDGVQPTQTVRVSATAAIAETCSVLAIPTALAFGDVPPDSSESMTLSLMNPGDRSCTVAGLEIAAGSTPGFTISGSASPSVGPRATVNVQVRFDSTGYQPGATASGFVRYTTADRSVRLVPLSARVARCLVVAPEEINFGNIKLGCASGSRSVQVFNSCGTAVRITSIGASGQGFGIAAAPLIPPGGLLLSPNAMSLISVSMNFRPPALGTHLGTLNLATQEGQSPRTLALPLRGVGAATGTTVETFTQPAQPQADILFSIDNSCSMLDEQVALAMNFGSFISYATRTNVDYRIAVTTSDDFAANGQGQFVGSPAIVTNSTPNVAQVFANRVNVGINGSGYERPVSTALKALTLPLTQTTNAGFLRDEANLAIIMVTDAPDQSPEPIAYYVARLPLVKGSARMHQVNVSAIGPFRQPTSGGCSIEGVDTGRYEAIIRATGGVKSDICSLNWATDLETLGNSALGPRSTFFVRSPPDPQQPIEVAVNGQQISNDWAFQPASNSIVFANGQAPGAGTTLTITYESQCF